MTSHPRRRYELNKHRRSNYSGDDEDRAMCDVITTLGYQRVEEDLRDLLHYSPNVFPVVL